MRRRLTRLMSWLLVAVLLLQENVMTVTADELTETVVAENEDETFEKNKNVSIEATEEVVSEEVTTEESVVETEGSVEMESETAQLTESEEATETEVVETDEENKNVSIETTEEATTEIETEDVMDETETTMETETVEETETVIEEEIIVVDEPLMANSANDNKYGDVEVLGDIVLQNSFKKNGAGDGITDWNTVEWRTNITSIEGSDDGKSVTINYGTGTLAADYQSAIYLTKDGFKLERGKSYKVTYKIKSTKAREIKSGFDYTNDRHQITLPADEEVSVEYNLTTDGEWNKFMFFMGGGIGTTDSNMGEHSITISDLVIQEITLQPADGTAVEETADNYIQYGTFADGTYEKLDEYWDINKDFANVKTSKYRVVFDVTGNGAWYQNWLKQSVTGLTPTAKYEIAFDIESEIDRKIVFGFDGAVWYQPVELKAGEATKVKYQVTGTSGGNFAIALGSNLPDSSYTDVNGNQVTVAAETQTLDPHRVSISNVRITELPVELPDTKNDTPYDKITSLKNHRGYAAADLSPLKDGNFTRGLSNWETWCEEWMVTWDVVKYTQAEDGMSVYIENTGGGEGNKPWDVQLNQKISLASDTEYVLSFKVHSEKARAINISIADIDNGAAWVKPIAIQKGETREVVLNLPILTEDAKDKLFSIQMGNVAGDVQKNTLTFSDMKLEVNGYGELAERITDGSFDEGTAGSFTTAGGADTLTASFTDKYLVANINKACDAEDASVSSGKFAMMAGNDLGGHTYTVNFVAGATENRTIKAVLVGDNGSVLKEETFDLTTEAKNYSFSYAPTTAQTAAYLKLLLGGAEGTVCVDTIRCDLTGYPEAKGLDVTAHDIKLLEKKVVPAISEMPASDAVAGKDVVLTFEKIDANADYKEALEGEDSKITVNGTEVPYTIGESGDLYTITLSKDSFNVSGDKATFDIRINVPWYEGTHIRQSVYATQKWKATWLEEFDGTALDESKWSYQEGNGAAYGIAGWGNNEQQYYTRDNLKVADGELVITAQKERREGMAYTSARIWTMNDNQETAKFSQTYGRMEAKMKLAGGEGYEGVWPAFWMLPEDTSIYGTWPLSGEIDILEVRGREPDKADGTVHYGKPYPNNESSGGVFEFSKSQYNADSDINDYHVYAVEWEPGEIRWYVDDELYYSYSNWYSQSGDNPEKYKYPAPFDQNFYIILNLAIGGSFDGNLLPSNDKLPVDMKVDYVRVYQSATPYEDVTEEPPVIKDEETDPATVKSALYDKDFAKIEINNANGLVPDVWNLMTLAQFGGSASFNTVTENGTVLAKITPENLGGAAHSIQLMQDLDMVKGYNYRISFDAKTEGNRKLNMKIGQDGTEGWSAYETFETTLTNELQHYVYEFQAGQTDLHSRVEFNIATSMAPVYIGNITYEIIDEIVIDEDVKKAPSENGNHVWNGSFNVGAINGLSYWHAEGTDAKVVREGAGYVFTATKGDLYQNGLYLLKNDTYKLTFDAGADAARTIDVIVSNKDGSKVYMNEQDVELTTERGSKTLTFTMPANISDDNAKLTFVFGESGEKVYITNICLVKTSYNNVNWDEVNAYPLLNGDFELGKTYWSTYGQEFEVVEENGNHYAKAKGIVSNDKWASMLIYSGMNLTGKSDYTFSFKVRGSKADETILVTLEDAGNNRVFEAADVAVSEEWTTYTYDLRFADSQNNIALKFQLGDASEAYDVEFDDVVLSAKGAPKAPGVVTAAGYNRLGEDVVLTYTGDAAWAQNAVVYVDDTAIDAKKVTVADGKMTIDKDVFGKSGRYGITVKSTGYTTTKEIKVSVYPMDGNRVLDGGFNGKLEDYWGTSYILNTFDSITIEGGKAKIHYGGAGYDEWGNIVPWAIMLIQEGIPVEQGKKYQISFTASATIDRPIQVMRNQGSEISEYVNVSKTPQVYEVEFVSTGDTMKLQFLLSTVRTDGGANTEADIFENHDIFIDNVCIKEMVDGKVEVDTTELRNLVNEYEKLERGNYTEESWNAFTKALADAKEALNKTGLTQAEINGIKDNLQAAIDALKVEETQQADKTKLNALIEQWKTAVQGNYTDESWKVFTDALTAAQKVAVKADATQDEVDAAKTALEKAVKGLKENGTVIPTPGKVDKTELNTLIAQWKETEQGFYTDDSWETFTEAFAEAEKVATKADATQDEVNAAKTALENAVSGLKVKEGLWMSKVGDVTYTGAVIKPAVDVYDGTTQLRKNKDYTISYHNNKKVGEATIKIKGKGNYAGTITQNFNIVAKDLGDADIVIDDLFVMANKPNKKGVAKAVTPNPVVKRNGKKLAKGTDYMVKLTDTSEGAYVKPGTYKVEIVPAEKPKDKKFVCGYTGKKTITITLADYGTTADAKQVLMSKVSVSKIKNQPYTGSEIKPVVTVKYGKTPLVPETDYTVEYSNDNNYEVGSTTTVKVIGKGKYVGVKTLTFKITGTTLKTSHVQLKLPQGGYTYDGTEKKPGVEVRLNKKSAPLKEGRDYIIVEYQNNTNAGSKAAVIIKGINNYAGTVKKTFKISAYNIQKNAGKKFEVVSKDIKVPYAKGKAKPVVEVAFGGKTLEQNVDYTLSWSNNSKVADKGVKNAPTISIKGKGNYTGTAKVTFTIEAQDIRNLTVKAQDQSVKNAKKYNKVNPTITDLDGKVLKKGTDYTITGYTYQDGTEIGQKEVPALGSVIRVSVTGKGKYTGTTYADFEIVANEYHLSGAVIEVTPQEYTGKEVEPKGDDVKVYFKRKVKQGKKTVIQKEYMVEGVDYVIEGYSKNIGKTNAAKITISGIGDRCGGTKTGSFRINAQSMDWADWFDNAASWFKGIF